jgi:glutathione S-transferase
MRACDMVHFERGTKQRYALGPIEEEKVKEGLERFHAASTILESELDQRQWLVGEAISYADFRMAAFLPFNDVARLPIDEYPAICRWYDQLESIEAWREPFRGLDAPELRPIAPPR